MCAQIKQIWVIFSHLKLCVAVARHDFRWVEIYLNQLRGFVKLKKFKKSEKSSPNSDFNFLGGMLIFSRIFRFFLIWQDPSAG